MDLREGIRITFLKVKNAFKDQKFVETRNRRADWKWPHFSGVPVFREVQISYFTGNRPDVRGIPTARSPGPSG